VQEEKKNEVQVWQPSEFNGTDLLPVAAGARDVDRTGRENIEAEDLVLPSLKLLQGSSEEVKQGVEGARAGLFWLSGAEEAFKPPLRVLACAHTKSRSLFPKEDRAEHQGLEECLSRDGIVGSRYGDCASCPYKEWDNENSRPPACSESHNFTVLTPLGPAVLRFSRTSIKAARKLLTAWSMSSDPLFSHPLVISTSIRTDKVNGRDSTTHVMETKWAQRETVPPHVQAAARAVHEQVKVAHERGKFGTTDETRDEG
jgi:hypothetical protein